MKYDGEELFIIEDFEDFDILYAPLRGYVAKVVKGADILGDGEFMSKLVGSLGSRELVDIQSELDRLHSSLPELSIPITDDCNLRCRYCYASAGDDGHTSTFTKEMVDSILDAYFGFIKEHGKEYADNGEGIVAVTMAGGGEPTSRPEIFRYAVERCKEHATSLGLRCEFKMPTNLTCGEELMRFIIDNFSHISVSMDGPKDIQDSQRPCRDGSGSFDKVMRNLRMLSESDVRFGFRVTVTRGSVDRMKEIADFFNDNFPGHSISFEKVHLMGRTLSEDDYPDELFNRRFGELLEYAKMKGIRVRNASMRRPDEIRVSFCRSVGVPNWTVTLDGSIASCTRDNMPDIFTFGRFDFENRRFDIDEEKIRKIRELNVLHYPECTDCFCKYICAGDCPDIRFISKPNCDLTRRLIANELKNMLEQGD